MNKRFKARIHWLSKDEGGRNYLPKGKKYAPIIKITKSPLKIEDFWSIFVENIQYLGDNETISEMKYLSDFAPNNLSADVEFELFEGNKLVAKGIILYEMI